MNQEKQHADAIGIGFQLGLESANAPIIGVDRDLKITLWNNKAVQVTGFTAEEVMTKDLVEEYIDESSKESVVFRRM